MADTVILCSVYFKNQRKVDNSGMIDFEVPFYKLISPYLNIPLGSQHPKKSYTNQKNVPGRNFQNCRGWTTFNK